MSFQPVSGRPGQGTPKAGGKRSRIADGAPCGPRDRLEAYPTLRRGIFGLPFIRRSCESSDGLSISPPVLWAVHVRLPVGSSVPRSAPYAFPE